ncbi:MAG: hypothetical protein AVDCRST_MAG36-160 [uncultured Nocardioidaceae bacterium]|uniref:Regulator of SigK n=1 Tax=uncultured Nocardioidaceae bacterium TaxID=253824 RepID=A0A6J4L122_9ACTN|nr:MAG: hypothetical protein AVDCRST_MAG36-160 [uncultured Nocardioidaceae bacterium]
MTTVTDAHTLSGAYALDALDAAEAVEFREHLGGCDACCLEVRELRDAAARMGAVETVRPPAALRARVLAAADRTPQLPPSTRPSTRSATPPPHTAEPSVVTRLARPRTDTRRGGRRWDRLAVAAAAVLLVGGGAVGIGQVLSDSDASPAEQVFTAEDARTVEEPTMNGGQLLVAVSPSRHQMAVDTSELPELGGDRVYQLWSIVDGEVASLGIIEEPGETAAMPLPEAGTQVALTIEPPGGSKLPKNAPILQVEPASV